MRVPDRLETLGSLNYAVTDLAVRYMMLHGMSDQVVQDVLEVLIAVQRELARRATHSGNEWSVAAANNPRPDER